MLHLSGWPDPQSAYPQAGDHTTVDDLRATARSVVPAVSRPESAFGSALIAK